MRAIPYVCLKLINSMNTITKLCMDCGEKIKGRSDKKFCNDQCRNNFNNKQNSEEKEMVRKVNSILKRNRKILAQSIPAEGKTKITKTRLIEKGFSIRYHTHTYITQKGSVYNFCYEFGYLVLDGDWLMLVKRNTESPESFAI